MRREEHLRAQDLLHFGRVAMGQQAVRHEVLVDGPEVQGVGGRPPGPGGARGRIDDDPASLDQPGPHEGRQGQPGRRRVAAGGGDERGPGQRFAKQLRQPVDGLVEELRRLVRLAVPGRVEGRVTQPEVGGQVDDDADAVAQGRHDPLRLPVREGAEHEIEAVEGVRAGRLVDHSRIGGGQRRRVLPHRLAGPGVSGDRGHLDVGVARQETQELNPRVARATDDAGFHRISIHNFAYSCGSDGSDGSDGLVPQRTGQRIEPRYLVHDRFQGIPLPPEHNFRGGRVEYPEHIVGGNASDDVGRPNDAIDMNAVRARGKPLVNPFVKVLEVIAHRQRFERAVFFDSQTLPQGFALLAMFVFFTPTGFRDIGHGGQTVLHARPEDVLMGRYACAGRHRRHGRIGRGRRIQCGRCLGGFRWGGGARRGRGAQCINSGLGGQHCGKALRGYLSLIQAQKKGVHASSMGDDVTTGQLAVTTY